MSELSSVLLVGTGLVTLGAVANWPALTRRIRRRKASAPQQQTSQPPTSPSAATPFALLKLP